MNSKLRREYLYIFYQRYHTLNGNNRHNKGFTIIELLIVIMTIGILSAIALPSVLSQAAKAKQVEAKNYTSAMNRAQQMYYQENAGFTTSMTDLAVGIKSQTENYNYLITIHGGGAVVTHNAVAIDSSSVKSYAGITYLESAFSTNNSGISTILCESNSPEDGSLQTATSNSCPANYEDLKLK